MTSAITNDKLRRKGYIIVLLLFKSIKLLENLKIHAYITLYNWILRRNDLSLKTRRKKYKSVIIAELKNIWSEIVKKQSLG